MRRRRRLDDPPESLGVLVHGPVVIGRAPGIAVGLRCIFGYPSVLLFQLVLRARGVQAEAAARRSDYGVGYHDSSAGGRRSRCLLSVEADGRPQDRELALTVGWPEAGLPEQTCHVTLGELGDLSARILPLT